jgi:hypothetical protein
LSKVNKERICQLSQGDEPRVLHCDNHLSLTVVKLRSADHTQKPPPPTPTAQPSNIKQRRSIVIEHSAELRKKSLIGNLQRLQRVLLAAIFGFSK